MPPLPTAIKRPKAKSDAAPPVMQQPKVSKRVDPKSRHPDALEDRHNFITPLQFDDHTAPVTTKYSRSSVGWFDGSRAYNPENRKDSGQVKAIDVAKAFDDDVAANGGKLHLQNPEHREIAAQALFEDAMYAMKARKGKKTGWYDRSMRKAMKHARQMFPEMQENKDLETVMKLAMAISSGGTDVFVNFRQACKQMHNYLMTGQFDENLSGGGAQQAAIQNSFATANEFLKKLSLPQLKKFLLTKRKVGEWKTLFKDRSSKNNPFAGIESKLDMGDELVDHDVYGSNVFGAKIGAFFANLHGKYEPVTMDRWFMRTINRIRGGLAAGDEIPLRTNAAKVYNFLLENPNIDPKYLHGHTRHQLMEDAHRVYMSGDPAEARRFVEWVGKRFTAFSNGDKATGEISFGDRNPLNNAARNLNTQLNIENITPMNARDRYHMRLLVDRTQQLLQQQGIEISNAELQALLWYHEKQLFKHLGYRSPRGESLMAFDEAAKIHHELTHINNAAFQEKPVESSKGGEQPVEQFHWQNALQERMSRRFRND
jgi:hypothetical protein